MGFPIQFPLIQSIYDYDFMEIHQEKKESTALTIPTWLGPS